MVRATLSTVPEEFRLETCEGGWVKLRRMSYGERLHRQDLAVSMQMEADTKTRKTEMNVKQMQTAVAQFELSTCIVDHNLEDENDKKLNFKNPLTFSQLDGRIGEEIARYIEEMHDWESTLPNSGKRSSTSSSDQVKVNAREKRLIPSTVE
jgi:hypothetical protein